MEVMLGLDGTAGGRGWELNERNGMCDQTARHAISEQGSDTESDLDPFLCFFIMFVDFRICVRVGLVCNVVFVDCRAGAGRGGDPGGGDPIWWWRSYSLHSSSPRQIPAVVCTSICSAPCVHFRTPAKHNRPLLLL